MAKSFSLFLARRYLKPRGVFVVIIHLISLLGVILGVLMLIVVLAVMRGFELLQKDLMLGVQPHLTVAQENGLPLGGGDGEGPRVEDVLAKIRAVPGVTAASPFVEGKMGFSRRSEGKSELLGAPLVRGLAEDDPILKEFRRPRKFRDPARPSLVVAGEPDLAKLIREDGGDVERAIINSALATAYSGFAVESEFQLHSLLQVDEFLETLQEKRGENPLIKDVEVDDLVQELRTSDTCVVSAVVDTPLSEQPFVMFVPLHLAQEAFELDGGVHGLGVYVTDPYDVDPVKASVAKVLPAGWKVSSWLDDNFLRLRAIRTERALTSTLLFFIIIVAAFCIMNTVIVTTVQKRREIGALKALGAREGQIVRVFLVQSALVGLVGSGLGVIAGLLVVRFIDPIRAALSAVWLDPFPSSLFDLARMPTDLRMNDVATIGLAAAATSILAAWLPAWAAARQDAAKALRND